MRNLKKLCLITLTIVGVLCIGGLAISTDGVEARTAFGFNCDSEDNSVFPYGFMCGSDPTNLSPINISVTKGGNNVPEGGTVNPGETIVVRGGYESHASTSVSGGLPRDNTKSNPSAVLVWSTLQTFNPDGALDTDIKNNINSVIQPSGVNAGNATRGCPSATNPVNSTYPGRVVGYRDFSGDYESSGSGPNAAPVAYNSSTGNGVVNCGGLGRMVYWEDNGPYSAEGAENRDAYGFTVTFPAATSGGQVCVRLNVSVRFTGDTSLFPGPSSSLDNVQQNTAASHLVKQSTRKCFTVAASPGPTATLTATCTTVSGRISNPPVGGKYKIFVNGSTSVTNQKAIPAGGNYSDPIDGVGIFGGGSTRVFTLRIYNSSGTQVGSDRDFSITRNCTQSQVSDCTQYIKTLAPDGGGGSAVYRFTVFPRNQNYYNPAGSPVSGSIAGTRGPWQNYSAAPAYQSGAINTGSNYSDSRASYNAGTKTYTLNFPPPTGPDWLIYIEKWDHSMDRNGNGTIDWYYQGGTGNVSAQANCYNVSCTISVGGGNIPPGGGPSDHEANTYYDAVATITNIGRQPLGWLAWSGNANATGNPSQGITVASGDTQPVSMIPSPLAPATQGAYALGGGVYYGAYLVGACVPAAVNVYQHFTLAPNASIGSVNPENPTSIPYNTGGGHGTDPYAPYHYTGAINSNAYSQLFWKPATGGSNLVHQANRNDNFNTRSYTDTYTNTNPITSGDQYCPRMTLETATGWIGPGGILGRTAAATDGACITVSNQPYVHVLGSDASSGGGFGNNCTTVHNGINTFLRTTGPKPAGSGAQFGAVSFGVPTNGSINGFSSAILRATDPIGSAGLSFANNGVVPGGPPEPALGGNFGTSASGAECAPDYFASKSDDLTTPVTAGSITATTTNATGDTVNRTEYYTPPPGNKLKIRDGIIDDMVNVTIFVDGDVHIVDDITYANTNWSYGGVDAIKKIPSFRLIAKGNIYVGKDVTRLDGLYVAQPTTAGTKGSIYTCTSTPGDGLIATPSHDLLGDCRKQLVVNGAFVAHKVYLSRSYGSVRNSYPGEHLGSTRPAGYTDCGDSGPAVSNDCAAEIFNFSPELYFAQPSVTPSSGPTMGKYEYITSLAPVL